MDFKIVSKFKWDAPLLCSILRLTTKRHPGGLETWVSFGFHTDQTFKESNIFVSDLLPHQQIGETQKSA